MAAFTRFLVFTVLLTVSITQAGIKASLDSLTGNQHTRIAWISGGTENQNLYGGGSLQVYDSQTDSTYTVLPPSTNQNKPILCYGGHKIVLTIDYKVYIIDWNDGSTKRYLADGICSDVWVDPTTGKEWIVVRAGRNVNSGIVYKCMIEDTSKKQTLWNANGAGDYYENWYQISADGKLAADFLPWNSCLIVQNGGWVTNGSVTTIGHGCWASLAPDNSYYSTHFSDDLGHNAVVVYKNTDSIATISLHSVPQPAGVTNPEEYFYPKFASKGPRFFLLNTGYDNGGVRSRVECCIGRFAADYKSFEKWVRITSDTLFDMSPDAWVGVEPLDPAIAFSSGSLTFTGAQDGADPAVQDQIVSTLYGTLTNVQVSSSPSWLVPQVSGSGASYMIQNTVHTNGLASGAYYATVTVGADNAVTRSYTVKLVITGTQVPTSLTINPVYALVPVNQTRQFTATVYDQSGAVMTTPPAITWSISGLGTIDGTGLFTAGTTAGKCTVTVQADTLILQAPITVLSSAERPIKIQAPAAGTVTTKGSTINIKWYGIDNILYYGIAISPDNGRHWCRLSAKPNKWVNSGQAGNYLIFNYSWIVTSSAKDDNGKYVSLISDSVKVRVFDYYDQSIGDNMNGVMAITGAIHLTSPADGQTYAVGDTMHVKFTASSYITGVTLRISPDNGKTWLDLKTGSLKQTDSGFGDYPWVIPASINETSIISDSVLVWVHAYGDESNGDQTEKPLSIRGSNPVVNDLGVLGKSVSALISKRQLLIVIPSNQPYQYSIVSMRGETVTQKAGTQAGKYVYKMRAPGVYFLDMRYGSKGVLRKKLIVQ